MAEQRPAKRPLEEVTEEQPRKRARTHDPPHPCDPTLGEWCIDCQTLARVARYTKELPTSTLCLLLEPNAGGGCPHRLAAYVTGLQLPPPVLARPTPLKKTTPADTLAHLLGLSEEPMAPPALDSSSTTTTTSASVSTPPFVMDVEDDILTAPAPANETLEERNAYEDAFDAKYGSLMVTPRAVKRHYRDIFWVLRGFQENAPQPMESRVFLRERDHKYFIDGSSENTISASTFIHQFFVSFDHKKDRTAALCVGTRRYKSTTTAEEVMHIWDVNRNTGTARHMAIEDFLHCHRDRLIVYEKSLPTVEPPPSFFRFLKRYPYLRPVRCEYTMFDPRSRICAQADSLMIDLRTMEYWLLDWKNTNEIRKRAFKNEQGQLEMGIHPLTAHMQDCNFNHYTLQLNFYRHLLETHFNFPIAKMLMVNFPPNVKPDDEPQEFFIDRLDVQPFFSLREQQLAQLQAAAA